MQIKRQFSVITALMCMLILTSCGSGISREDYGAVCAERDALQAHLEALQKIASEAPEKRRVKISGQFSAMVRALIPDYVVDGFTPRAAVVTEFQAAPFSLLLGDRAGELEAGEVYVFEIEPKEVEVPADVDCQFEPALALQLYDLRISNIRPADTESGSEWGLQPKGIEYEIIE